MSGSWSQGYFVDAPYTRGFYPEQTPPMMAWASLMAGVEPPPLDRPFTFLELGCGQAQTAAVIAAAFPQARVVAVDFNPDHIINASRHAERSGLDNLEVVERAFADMGDLDIEADYAAMHGVVSWVSREVMEDIVDVLRAKVATGGLLYTSYNALPGRAAAISLQRLLRERYDYEQGTTRERVRNTMAFAGELRKAAQYFKDNPGVSRHLEGALSRDTSYLPHEYLNDAWEPMFFADVERFARRAKLTWVGSADPIQHVPDLSMTKAMRAILEPIGDPTHRETIRDFLHNTHFRRDLFGRGRNQLPASVRARRILEQRFVLARRREDCRLTVTVPAGEVHLNAEPYAHILNALTDGPLTGLQINETLEGRDDTLHVSLMVLSAVGYILPALPEAGAEARRARITRFNRYWLDRIEEDHVAIASPVTGIARVVGRIEALMVRGLLDDAPNLADYVADVLARHGHHLVLDGKPLDAKDALMEELAGIERRFREIRLPIFRLQGMV